MTERPTIAIAHWPGLRLFDGADLDVLAGVGSVLDPEPIGAWDDPRADELLGRAEVLLAHWGCPRIDETVLERAPNLGLIAYAAGTVKATIAPQVLDRVRVTSGAPANAEPVAEFTLAMILLCNKDALFRRDELRDPSIASARRRSEIPVGNWDKTVGIVGASLVGRRVIELLRSFPHLRPVLYDPFVDAEEAERLGVTQLELDDLCGQSDIVSVHAPDLPETRGMIGARQLAAMRTGATFINTARGRLVDHDALVAEVGRIYAVLDVTHPEPLPDDHPLRTSPAVFLTPHLAGSQGTELRRMTRHAADEIARWTRGEPGRNVVTAAALDRIA